LYDPLDYTVTTITVDGDEMQIIEFAVDPMDPARPNEFEVAADVRGKTDDGTSGGELITNLVEQQKDYLLNECDVDISELSVPHYAAAVTLADEEEYVGAAWIGKDGLAPIDVINTFSKTFLMPFFLTRDGLFAVSILTANSIFGLTGEFEELTDSVELFRDTFQVLSNQGEVASRLTYAYDQDWKEESWQRIFDQENTQELVNLGPDFLVSREMDFISETATANRVAAARLLLAVENKQYVEFEIPASYHETELNDIVAITHHQGLGRNGYVSVPFQVVALEINLMPREARIRVLAARVIDDAAHCDSHADEHSDITHSDEVHQDVVHTDTHSDAAHGDSVHLDAHNDTPHGDSSHADQHSDVYNHTDHSDTAHSDSGGHSDSGAGPIHGDHSDGPHIDFGDLTHNDSATHTDTHSDVSHGDSSHADQHADTAHADAHSDSHGDVVHADAGHGDIEHVDTEHNDFHADTDFDHTDTHDDHTDGGHDDTTVEHSDVHHADEE